MLRLIVNVFHENGQIVRSITRKVDDLHAAHYELEEIRKAGAIFGFVCNLSSVRPE